MAGELLAFRRAGVGAPISEYGRIVDRARVNKGGKATTVAAANPVTASSTYGTQATAGAQHVKGNWVELVASTSFAAETLIITMHEVVAAATTNTGMLLDIGIGAAASETVLVPDLLVGFSVASSSGAGAVGQTIIVPISVAAGTRIAARIQGHAAADTATIGLQYRASGFADTPGVACTAIGVSSSGATTGTALTTAVSTNTKADWTQLTASTTAAYRYLLVAMQCTSNSVITAADGLVDIGIGGSGSETVIIPDLPYIMTGNEQMKYIGCELPYKVSIPSGTRIAARYQASSTNAAAKPVVAVYGIT